LKYSVRATVTHSKRLSSGKVAGIGLVGDIYHKYVCKTKNGYHNTSPDSKSGMPKADKKRQC